MPEPDVGRENLQWHFDDANQTGILVPERCQLFAKDDLLSARPSPQHRPDGPANHKMAQRWLRSLVLLESSWQSRSSKSFGSARIRGGRLFS